MAIPTTMKIMPPSSSPGSPVLVSSRSPSSSPTKDKVTLTAPMMTFVLRGRPALAGTVGDETGRHLCGDRRQREQPGAHDETRVTGALCISARFTRKGGCGGLFPSR